MESEKTITDETEHMKLRWYGHARKWGIEECLKQFKTVILQEDTGTVYDLNYK